MIISYTPNWSVIYYCTNYDCKTFIVQDTGHRVQCYKTFCDLQVFIISWRDVVPGNIIESILMFAGKARAYPRESPFNAGKTFQGQCLMNIYEIWALKGL